MPKKVRIRSPNAASVRRRLIFDDELNDSGVASSISDTSLNAHLSKPQGPLLTEEDIYGGITHTDNGKLDQSKFSLSHAELVFGDDSVSEFESENDEVFYGVFLVCIAFIVISFLSWPWTSSIFSGFQVERAVPGGSLYLVYKNNKLLCLLSLLVSVLCASFLGLLCCGFSWLIIYYDSYKPGRIPPTPLSPSKYKRESGHTFHMSYLISLVNGSVLFVYFLWYSRDYFLR